MSVREGATTIGEINPLIFTNILEIIQSGELRTIHDVYWTLVVNPNSIENGGIIGRGSKGIPPWLKQLRYHQSWTSHETRDGYPVNCAAFALAQWMNSGNRTPRGETVNFGSQTSKPTSRALMKALDLQADLGWSFDVSLLDIEKFVLKYSFFRVYCFILIKHNPETTRVQCYKGINNDESPNNDCYLVFFENHWALAGSINNMLSQMVVGGTFSFCQPCVRVVRHVIGEPEEYWKCHYSSGSSGDDSAIEDDSTVEPPKKKKKIKVWKKCGILECNGHVHSENDKCKYHRCKFCRAPFNNLEEPHRCAVLPKSFGEEHPYDKFWDEEEQDYKFAITDGDGKVPAFFAYDMETMVVEEEMSDNQDGAFISPPLDSNFGQDLEEYTELINLYLTELAANTPVHTRPVSKKIKRFVPNLIIATNIYSSKIPLNEDDLDYDPEMFTFKGTGF